MEVENQVEQTENFLCDKSFASVDSLDEFRAEPRYVNRCADKRNTDRAALPQLDIVDKDSRQVSNGNSGSDSAHAEHSRAGVLAATGNLRGVELARAVMDNPPDEKPMHRTVSGEVRVSGSSSYQSNGRSSDRTAGNPEEEPVVWLRSIPAKQPQPSNRDASAGKTIDADSAEPSLLNRVSNPNKLASQDSSAVTGLVTGNARSEARAPHPQDGEAQRVAPIVERPVDFSNVDELARKANADAVGRPDRVQSFTTSSGKYEFSYKDDSGNLSSVKLPGGLQIMELRTGVIALADERGRPLKALTDVNGTIKSTDHGFEIRNENGKTISSRDIPGLADSLQWKIQRTIDKHRAEQEKSGRLDDSKAQVDSSGRVELLLGNGGKAEFRWDGDKPELAAVRVPGGNTLEKIDGMIYLTKDDKPIHRLTDAGGAILPQDDGILIVDGSGKPLTSIELSATKDNLAWKIQQLKIANSAKQQHFMRAK